MKSFKTDLDQKVEEVSKEMSSQHELIVEEMSRCDDFEHTSSEQGLLLWQVTLSSRMNLYSTSVRVVQTCRLTNL